MSFLSSIPIIGSLITKTHDIIDQAVTDKDKANELKNKINTLWAKNDLTIQIASLQSKWKTVATWRPICAKAAIFTTLAICILYVCVVLFSKDLDIAKITLIDGMIKTLIGFDMLFLTTYAAGRTIEKITNNIDPSKVWDLIKKNKER